MQKLEFTKPFDIGGKKVKGAQIAPLHFVAFVAVSRKALAQRTDKVKYEVLMQRERLLAQVTLTDADDKPIKLTLETLTTLPLGPAKQLVTAINADGDDVAGDVLQDGDGIDTPILYKLGTPIKASNGKAIEELEFMASSFGDIETVLAGAGELYQTVDLIATVAKPVGGTLLSLPSWAVDQITLADGLTISNKVLPRFLG